MAKDPNNMDIDAVKLPKKLTSEEYELWAKKGFCFHCCKSGHMVSACLAFSECLKKPHIQHTQKEKKLSEFKEIEDNNEEEGVAWISFGLDKDF